MRPSADASGRRVSSAYTPVPPGSCRLFRGGLGKAHSKIGEHHGGGVAAGSA
jgi:hypothetical protein